MAYQSNLSFLAYLLAMVEQEAAELAHRADNAVAPAKDLTGTPLSSR